MTERGTGFRGTVIRFGDGLVALRSDSGATRTFHHGPGAFELEGRIVTLGPPERPAAKQPEVTASGSFAVADAGPRVARAGRILVEGVHDAELIERVWGDDLRAEGVVVEVLDGADDLAAAVAARQPGPGRHVGVLLDHLVPGTKEQRLARTVEGPHVTVTGHPFVDVWQVVRPARLGIRAWPEIPRGRPWKAGVLAALGYRGSEASFWREVLGRVRSYADLEPSFVGAVETLVDAVTETP